MRARAGSGGSSIATACAWTAPRRNTSEKPRPMCVTNSAIEAGALAGMEVVLAHPPGWELDPDVVAGARTIANATGGSVSVTNDQGAAFDGAAAVYAKSWGALSCYGDWTR